MAVERIDPLIAGLISQAQLDTQQKVDKHDEEDAARKAAEKKQDIQKGQLKQGDLHTDSLRKNKAVDQKLQQILGGKEGQRPQEALGAWLKDTKLQSKLTEAQKQLFRESFAQNPKKAAEGAEAGRRLEKQPGFEKAVHTSQQRGTLHQGLFANPKAEKPIAEVLQGRFMQSESPRADKQTKHEFLRFGFQQAAKGQLDSLKHAGDMLGTLAQTKTPAGAQRAAMSMTRMRPTDSAAMGELKTRAEDVRIQRMGPTGRGEMLKMLARTGAKPEFGEQLGKLAGALEDRSLTVRSQFARTIALGKPKEYPQLVDKSLEALRTPGFPTSDARVGRYLKAKAQVITTKGADAVNVRELIQKAKSSPLPQAPSAPNTEGLSEQDAALVMRQFRANLGKYYTDLTRHYQTAEKQLQKAQYFEDVNTTKNLVEPGHVDDSKLPSDLRELNGKMRKSAQEAFARASELQQDKLRLLRRKRLSPAKRRAREAKARLSGTQPRYIVLGTRAGAVFAKAAGAEEMTAPQTRGPMQRGGALGARLQQQVAAAVGQLAQGPVTADRVAQVAQTIAGQIAQQVAQQITKQLLGAHAAAPVALPTEEATPTAAGGVRTDGWGVPRTSDRDLGGMRLSVVKPREEGLTYEDVEGEKYVGKALTKATASVRNLGDILASEDSWRALPAAERALLKNLGWGAQPWNSRKDKNAHIPVAMATLFVNLSGTQREAVRKLDSPHDWDTRVQALLMGKQA